MSVASSPTQVPYGLSSLPAALPPAPAVPPSATPAAPPAPPRLLPPSATPAAPPTSAPPVAEPACPAALSPACPAPAEKLAPACPRPADPADSDPAPPAFAPAPLSPEHEHMHTRLASINHLACMAPIVRCLVSSSNLARKRPRVTPVASRLTRANPSDSRCRDLDAASQRLRPERRLSSSTCECTRSFPKMLLT